MANDPITYHKLRQKARDFLLTAYQTSEVECL